MHHTSDCYALSGLGYHPWHLYPGPRWRSSLGYFVSPFQGCYSVLPVCPRPALSLQPGLLCFAPSGLGYRLWHCTQALAGALAWAILSRPFRAAIVCCLFAQGLRCRSSLGYFVSPLQGLGIILGIYTQALAGALARAILSRPFRAAIVCCLFAQGLRCRSSLGYYVSPLQGWDIVFGTAPRPSLAL
jgi:hypothetical protein